VAAAVTFMSDHSTEKLDDIITIMPDERCAAATGEHFNSAETLLVLQIGMDVRVIPESGDRVPLIAPVFDTVGAAVSTADMEKK